MGLRNDADKIIEKAIAEVLPDAAVKKALAGRTFGNGRLILVAIGKAAWQMAKAAHNELEGKISEGIVITKYHHNKGAIGSLQIFEAGHPVPDENSYRATQAVIDMINELSAEDTVLFLISGGGSALFEKPLISATDMDRLTNELLASGADIVEMNTIRKRFSAVKGGRFGAMCAPAKVFSIVLSDIIGDPLDMIASGPAYPDSKTAEEAVEVAEKYHLTLTDRMKELLLVETPKELHNVESHITGSVSELCVAAANACKDLGYEPTILTASLACEAKEAGVYLADIAKAHQSTAKSLAFIAGGETVVKITGDGLGGRNQELVLAAAEGIFGLEGTAIFSVGSDGTDGPTDAAGGYVDKDTAEVLAECGLVIASVLQRNDAYHALDVCGGLIKTGPTGTNVNDVAVVLIKR